MAPTVTEQRELVAHIPFYLRLFVTVEDHGEARSTLVGRQIPFRIEKVRGSIPLSSTPGQRPSPEIFLRVTGPSYSSRSPTEAVSQPLQRGAGGPR